MGLGYLGAALFVGQGTPVVDPPPLLLSARVATRVWYVVQVSHILDTTMASLDEDPTLKFHWAETVWLSMWLAAGNASYKVDLLTRLYQQVGGGDKRRPRPLLCSRCWCRVVSCCSPTLCLLHHRHVLNGRASWSSWVGAGSRMMR